MRAGVLCSLCGIIMCSPLQRTTRQTQHVPTPPLGPLRIVSRPRLCLSSSNYRYVVVHTERMTGTGRDRVEPAECVPAVSFTFLWVFPYPPFDLTCTNYLSSTPLPLLVPRAVCAPLLWCIWASARSQGGHDRRAQKDADSDPARSVLHGHGLREVQHKV